MTPRIDGAAMAEWCAMLRDDNAIHLDRGAAAAAGFGPRRVNPGPANLAYVISAALQDDPARQITRVTAQFHTNVLEDDLIAVSPEGLRRGDDIVLSATVTFAEPDDD